MNSKPPAIPVKQMCTEKNIQSQSLLDLMDGSSEKISNQDELGATGQLVNTISSVLKCAICLELFANPVILNEWYDTN